MESNIYIYYRWPSQMLLDVIDPLLRRATSFLSRAFWELHNLGGSHVRVHLVGEPAEVESATRSLFECARQYFALHPSEPDPRYSVKHARAAWLRETGIALPEEAYAYRVDEVCQGSYWKMKEQFASTEALKLLEEFLQLRMPLAASLLLHNEDARKGRLLRMYWLPATMGFETMAQGCVSYRSHWEGFASRSHRRPAVNRIHEAYQRNRSRLADECRYVQSVCDGSESDAELRQWETILNHVTRRALIEIANGKRLTFQAESAAQVLHAKSRMPAEIFTTSKFIVRLYEDERFLASWGHEPRLIIPRIRTNLLYSMVRDLNFSLFDRYTLCYFAFKTVEALFDVDLCDMLADNVQQIAKTAFGVERA